MNPINISSGGLVIINKKTSYSLPFKNVISLTKLDSLTKTISFALEEVYCKSKKHPIACLIIFICILLFIYKKAKKVQQTQITSKNTDININFNDQSS